jgi:hypothetical protein
MPKRSLREKLFEWRITRIRATPARLIGYVQAPEWCTIIPAVMHAVMTSRVVSMVLNCSERADSRAKQKNRGVTSRSRFGSIDPFG